MTARIESEDFGQLLRRARETRGLTQRELGRQIDLDGSYIYRMETGERRPSRSSALALAEALHINGDALDRWLIAAGFAPMPLLSGIQSGIRTRGAKKIEKGKPSGRDMSLWGRLEAIGLREGRIERLLRTVEMAKASEIQTISESVSTTLAHLAEALEAPVHTAVIPAAGGQHRLVAAHVMQRLLLQVIREASESGITNTILILAPGTAESLYTPLKEALDLAVIPRLRLDYIEQASPEGLGDAVLQAEPLVGENPFAILLPDDFLRERPGRGSYTAELRRMMEAFIKLDNSNLFGVKSVSRSRLPHCGAARVGAKETVPGVFAVRQLVEKPDPGQSICRSEKTLGIVGRYLLEPEIFRVLRDLKEKGCRPVELTDALEHLRQEGKKVYAFLLKAERQDIGEALGQASKLLENNPE